VDERVILSTMKRLRLGLTTLVMAVTLVACGPSPSDSPTAPSVPSPAATPEPELSGVRARAPAITVYDLSLSTGVVGTSDVIAVPAGSQVYVVDSSVSQNGRLAYRILWARLISDELESEMGFGWIDARREDGAPNLGEWITVCPEPPTTLESLQRLYVTEWQVCLGSGPFEVTAFPGSGCREGNIQRSGFPDWLNGTYRSYWTLPSPIIPGESHGGPTELWLRPGISLPCDGEDPLHLTIHLDDPAAAACRATVGLDGAQRVEPALSVALCRLRPVVDAVEIGPAPSDS